MVNKPSSHPNTAKKTSIDKSKYTELTERLRSAGFSPDENSQGNQTYQRWRLTEPVFVTVDFLIEPSDEDDRGGTLHHIERDFATIITPGLHLAFEDRKNDRFCSSCNESVSMAII